MAGLLDISGLIVISPGYLTFSAIPGRHLTRVQVPLRQKRRAKKPPGIEAKSSMLRRP